MADTVVSGYGALAVYRSDYEDDIDEASFARYDRIASRMIDALAGRTVDAGNPAVQEAAHWQIWFMRQRGSVKACMESLPKKERFAEYSIERASSEDRGGVTLFGMEVGPMMLSVLRVGGVISLWI